jgi:hypothetical protein
MFKVGPWLRPLMSRRQLLATSIAIGGSTAALAQAAQTPQSSNHDHTPERGSSVHSAHGDMITVGRVDDAKNGFDPCGS